MQEHGLLNPEYVVDMAPAEGAIRDSIAAIAERWRADRSERQRRRHLEQADFDELRDAGFLLTVVPEEAGGLWRDPQSSARLVCDLLRALAAGDPAVALVSAMHPSVVSFWLLNPDPSQPAWEAQRQAVFASAAAGQQWGTITSEPGSGGDIARTRAAATPAAANEGDGILVGPAFRVSGDKHFGSGSGIAHRMVTTAKPGEDDDPRMFVLDTTDHSWDGSHGMTLIAEWDGIGMAATQSHAMRLDGALAVQLAYDGPLTDLTAGAGAFVATTFTAVVLGVLDEAIATAKRQLAPKAQDLRAYEQVEWSRACNDHWLATQAYEGAIRAIETADPGARFASLCAKQGVAELAEASLARLSRVIGGGAYSRRNPFAHWSEDVRALGFLRPPWGLAYDNLFALSFV
jgi:alkylation response protein AidB-like acyl-CoA dehydrogenase